MMTLADLKIDIRKNETIKNIEINDNGDVITIDFGDNEFMKKLFEFEKTAKSMKDVDNLDFDKFTNTLYSMIENLFGKGVIFKIFGRDNPSFIPVYDFMQQLMEFVGDQMQKHFGKNLNRSQRRANARG